MSDVSVPTTPTNPDLREQIPSAIADPGAFVPRAKRHGAGGQYESVPQWAARAVGSLVWPLVAEARAEADMHRRTRLRVERVLDEALGAEEKDGTGEGLAADVRLAITRRDEEIDRLRRALAGHLFDGESLSTRDAIRVELIEQQHAELVRQRESRMAWALEADRLQQIADNAITALEKLRDEQLDRIAPVECDCAEHGVDCHAAGAQFAYMRAIRIVRPSVSDQTPATPDDVPAVRITVGPTPTEPRPFLDAIFGPDRQWHDVPVGEVVCSCHGVNVFEPPVAAPSSVQGDTTPPLASCGYHTEAEAEVSIQHELCGTAYAQGATSAPSEGDTTPEAACVHGQTADLTGLAAGEAQS